MLPGKTNLAVQQWYIIFKKVFFIKVTRQDDFWHFRVFLYYKKYMLSD